MTLTAMAGAVLLLGVQTSLQTAIDATEHAQALGMAHQLMDEILGQRYMEAGVDPHQSVPGPSYSETLGPGRSRFDDTDDYNGYGSQPVEDRWGYELGRGDGAGDLRHPNFQVREGEFESFSQEVEVYYVDPDDPSVRLPAGETSDYRAADVRVYRHQPDSSRRELVHLRRVYAYVPPPK